jgi:two-component system chemotaxis response regulator CheB
MNAEAPPRSVATDLDLIVIGGSAGAIEALSEVLANLPDELTVPIALTLHLPPDQPSLLPQVLAPVAGRPVREPQDKEPLARSTIYVAPAGYHLLIDSGPAFALSLDEPVHFSRPSIDVLFESAADTFGPRLAGVLLSGANADGARGLRAIEAAGGTAIIQAPGEASSPVMPKAALALCDQARVLPARSIRERLIELATGKDESDREIR